MGIKRGAAIAKKIALLVFTDLIFFTFPLVFGAFALKLWFDFVLSASNTLHHYSLTKSQWLIFILFALPRPFVGNKMLK